MIPLACNGRGLTPTKNKNTIGLQACASSHLDTVALNLTLPQMNPWALSLSAKAHMFKKIWCGLLPLTDMC